MADVGEITGKKKRNGGRCAEVYNHQRRMEEYRFDKEAPNQYVSII